MHSTPANWRTTARYSIYTLLALNIAWYFQAEFAGSSELLVAATGWATLLTVFSETVDTLAWVALVLLFELEISLLPVERQGSWLARLLSGLRAICYAAVLVSIYGYWSMWQTVNNVEPVTRAPCALAEQDYSYLAGLDDYPELTTANCGQLDKQPLALIAGTRIIGSEAQFSAARIAAIVDLVNAVTWLVVVVIMEAEIYLQLLGGFRERWRRISKWLLAPLYLVLLGCAVYWLLYSDFLDFWDALLWLVAFAFIELNILDWRNDQTNPLAGSD